MHQIMLRKVAPIDWYKDDEAKLCSVWQLLQCVNSKFLVKKTFPQRRPGFYFLAWKMFQSHRRNAFLTVNIFQCFDLLRLRWLHPSRVTDTPLHFLEHMSSCGSTQVLPFGGKRIDFIHEFTWVFSVNTTQLKTPKRYPFHQTLFQTWIYQRDFHTDQEKWNRSITSF